MLYCGYTNRKRVINLLFFNRKKKPTFTVGKADSDAVTETYKHIEATLSSFLGTFGSHYTQAERTQYARTTLELLHGYTPHTHRELTASDKKKLKKMLTEI